MIRRSSRNLKYTNYSEYNLKNVWVSDQKRLEAIERLMIADKNFKLTSLKVNPIYKPIFDKLDARATKEIQRLEDSYLWSPSYTKSEYKHMFSQPLFFHTILVGLFLYFGVRYRIYLNYIKNDRKLEFAEKLNIDLEDIDSYPKAALEMLVERKKYDAYIEKKDEKITQIEDSFHKYAEERILRVAEMRKKRGLRDSDYS
ncbi:unnamed protein product [Moneuplotes crassus]|uniref:Transmembrane protein n=1 Tax=Euplotes crassus TaxID=5936 RepID=A0AAD1XYT6_EUPCR|nr:unnamed protein product [Moneuplotes crassus]